MSNYTPEQLKMVADVLGNVCHTGKVDDKIVFSWHSRSYGFWHTADEFIRDLTSAEGERAIRDYLEKREMASIKFVAVFSGGIKMGWRGDLHIMRGGGFIKSGTKKTIPEALLALIVKYLEQNLESHL